MIDLSGQPTGATLRTFALSFDESSGKLSGYNHPFKKNVHTHVELSYIAAEK